MKTTFHEQPIKISDFFVVLSVSAGEHPLVKRSGALQGDEIFIYLVDICSLLLRYNSWILSDSLKRSFPLPHLQCWKFTNIFGLSLSQLLCKCVRINNSPWSSLHSPCLLCRWCVIPLAPRQLRNTYHRSILQQWQKFGLSMIWSEKGVGGLVWAVMNRTQLQRF